MRQVFWLVPVDRLPEFSVALMINIPLRGRTHSYGDSTGFIVQLHRISLLIPFGNRISTKLQDAASYSRRVIHGL